MAGTVLGDFNLDGGQFEYLAALAMSALECSCRSRCKCCAALWTRCVFAFVEAVLDDSVG